MSEQLAMQVMKAAMTPLGQSVAAAIVCSVIYFLFMCLAIYSFIVTKYSWYDVVIISTSFRSGALACRAAYLVNYSPGLQGSFLAFSNAGFSASGAAMLLTMGACAWVQKWTLLYRMKHKGVKIFSDRGEVAARLFCYLMSIPIVAFGPILGVIAAGLIYGAYHHSKAANIGSRCRRATTYAFVGIFLITFFWAIILTLRILVVKKRRHGPEAISKAEEQTTPHSRKNPFLIAFFIPVSAILLIRAANGAVALYMNKEFVWADDTWFYCLDTLPEFMSLVVLCWPKLLARISCAYPPESKEASSSEPNQLGKQQNERTQISNSPGDSQQSLPPSHVQVDMD